MIRVIVLLFWLSMIIGTLLAHNVVANWAVTLAGLYFFSRWWAGRRRAETATARTGAARASAPVAEKPRQPWGPAQNTRATPADDAQRSRWTADRTHTARGVWR